MKLFEKIAAWVAAKKAAKQRDEQIVRESAAWAAWVQQHNPETFRKWKETHPNFN